MNGDHANSAGAAAARPRANGALLAPGERAPYDTDAT